MNRQINGHVENIMPRHGLPVWTTRGIKKTFVLDVICVNF